MVQVLQRCTASYNSKLSLLLAPPSGSCYDELELLFWMTENTFFETPKDLLCVPYCTEFSLMSTGKIKRLYSHLFQTVFATVYLSSYLMKHPV